MEYQRCGEHVVSLIERSGVPMRMLNASEKPFPLQLKQTIDGCVCVLGVGNRYRRDDGAGSLVAEHLVGRTDARSIDAGEAPENYLEQVARSHPDTVLILDAFDFGGAPGDLRILDPELAGSSGLSTHALSLRMTADYLSIRTHARLALLAIQPADIGLGTELSEEVSRAVEMLKETLVAVLNEHVNGQHASTLQ